MALSVGTGVRPSADVQAARPSAHRAGIGRQSARGDNTSIDLRGLGSGSTLVLVNGRRMPPHPISQSEFGTPALSVNINTVPSGLSSRVEILRDGASAIYGSEAAAGVVNHIVAPRFDGLRTSVRGSMTEDGGGRRNAKFMLQEAPGAVLGDDLWEDGRAEWRWNASLRWRKGNWSAGWFTSYYGTFVDTGAATTLAVYDSLGRPDYIDATTTTNAGATRYLLKVEAAVSHNLSGGYRFDRRHKFAPLRNTSLRLGVNNVFNTDPPIADAVYGDQSGAYNPRGRQYWLELEKSW